MIIRRVLRIVNEKGLHARASAKFVQTVSAYDAHVTVSKDGTEVTGTSIMGLMMLGAAMGDSILITARGDNHEEALAQLVALVDDKFGED